MMRVDAYKTKQLTREDIDWCTRLTADNDERAGDTLRRLVTLKRNKEMFTAEMKELNAGT